jgi:antitoxin ParD1/3/4
MASRFTLNVSLPPELDKFVASRVSSGRYRSASDVVLAALRLLEEQELARQTALEGVRQKIAVGLDQADRGELFDGEEVFREILGKL